VLIILNDIETSVLDPPGANHFAGKPTVKQLQLKIHVSYQMTVIRILEKRNIHMQQLIDKQ
jgi:hypothetical protein